MKEQRAVAFQSILHAELDEEAACDPDALEYLADNAVLSKLGKGLSFKSRQPLVPAVSRTHPQMSLNKILDSQVETAGFEPGKESSYFFAVRHVAARLPAATGQR